MAMSATSYWRKFYWHQESKSKRETKKENEADYGRVKNEYIFFIDQENRTLIETIKARLAGSQIL